MFLKLDLYILNKEKERNNLAIEPDKIHMLNDVVLSMISKNNSIDNKTELFCHNFKNKIYGKIL